MEILIEQIKEEGLVFKFEKSAAAFPVLAEMVDHGECEFSAPVRTALKVQRIGRFMDHTYLGHSYGGHNGGHNCVGNSLMHFDGAMDRPFFLALCYN